MNSLSSFGLILEDLIPHRGSMLLVEEVLEVDRRHALTLCRARPEWPMADAAGVHPLILVELAAQTAGVCNGWDRVQTKGRGSDPSGWLVGIKQAEFSISHLPFGSCIRTRAETTQRFDKLREVFCVQHIENRENTEDREDKRISSITLQLFQASADDNG